MEKAAFKLYNYRFTKASLDFNIPNDAELNISFNPKGVFYAKRTPKKAKNSKIEHLF